MGKQSKLLKQRRDSAQSPKVWCCPLLPGPRSRLAILLVSDSCPFIHEVPAGFPLKLFHV